MRIGFFAANPREGASVRFRILQYFPCLEAVGARCAFYPFFTSEENRILYSPGGTLRKILALLGGVGRRLSHLRSLPPHDLYVVHREIFPFFQLLPFHKLKQRGQPIAFDFDDALFMPQPLGSLASRLLKSRREFDTVVRWSDLVLAGNPYLTDYAARLNPRSICYPTMVDTRLFRPPATGVRNDPPVIGWIGSHSTLQYLKGILPVFQELARRQPFRLLVVGANRSVSAPGIPLVQKQWELSEEVADVQGFDVGVYPLPDNPWTRGKCGFKAMQYMACAVPVVASPVGVTEAIVRDGVTGFLAKTHDEWLDRLTWLLRDRDLRQKMGQAGRQLVDERYSVSANFPRLWTLLRETVGEVARQTGREGRPGAGVLESQ